MKFYSSESITASSFVMQINPRITEMGIEIPFPEKLRTKLMDVAQGWLRL